MQNNTVMYKASLMAVVIQKMLNLSVALYVHMIIMSVSAEH